MNLENMDRITQWDERFEERTANRFRDLLVSQGFKLYDKSHHVDCSGNDLEGFHLFYGVNRGKLSCPEKTLIACDVFKRDYCGIYAFNIKESLRGMGHGAVLYLAVENLAREHDCTRVVVAPSNDWERGLWERMEFVPVVGDDKKMEKPLS